MKIFVAITGASGTVYARRLANYLADKHQLFLTISSAGMIVIKEELGVSLKGKSAPEIEKIIGQEFGVPGNIKFVASNDFFSFAASGTGGMDAMIVIPCSMGTLGRIAHGISGNLIERAADVALKENIPLLIVPRETPLNQIHLENLLSLKKCGAQIIPAMPAFYGHSKKVEDLVDFVVGKVLDQLRIEHDLLKRWGKVK